MWRVLFAELWREQGVLNFLPALLIVGFVIAACTTPPPITACPAPVHYTDEQQARAADELAALPPGAELRGFMADYGREREMLRRCAR